MGKRNINQMLKAFRCDFELTYAEVAVIVKPDEISGYEKRVRRMDKIRREMKEEAKPEAMQRWLFANNKNLGMSYFDAMVAGQFDSVIEDIMVFNHGIYR